MPNTSCLTNVQMSCDNLMFKTCHARPHVKTKSGQTSFQNKSCQTSLPTTVMSNLISTHTIFQQMSCPTSCQNKVMPNLNKCHAQKLISNKCPDFMRKPHVQHMSCPTSCHANLLSKQSHASFHNSVMPTLINRRADADATFSDCGPQTEQPNNEARNQAYPLRSYCRDFW